MASTKGINTKLDERQLKSLKIGIQNKLNGIKNEIEVYETQSGGKFPFEIKNKDDYDYINPQHYVKDDGRQTWEHMVEDFGLESTAIFCELNAYKYRDRIGKKPNEDASRELKKIEWYENKAQELREQLKLENKKSNLGGLFS